MKHISIAIDGPAGAGKSTLARALARQLGYFYVDTGAIYRTVALRALRAGADPADPAQVIPLLEGLDITMDYGPDGEQRMFLAGEDVSRAIREHKISGLASKKARGLFFAGELLDVDAYTGGFNLQIAWATGRAAGEGAARSLREAQ